jgi:dTDP-4-amino-4,6-dideoxygalactose transaminase
VHYPIPLHRQPALQDGGCSFGELPAADRLGETVLSLPVFPELSDDDARMIAEAVAELTPAGVR